MQAHSGIDIVGFRSSGLLRPPGDLAVEVEQVFLFSVLVFAGVFLEGMGGADVPMEIGVRGLDERSGPLRGDIIAGRSVSAEGGVA